ncbi:nuclear mRNA export, poly(A)+RNA binding protein [Serendipita sp. 399]|nr:nuclear mRNA export, poly(A)+RNA binding protein [Serendipita sp. 399]
MSTSLPVTPQRPRPVPVVSAPRRNAASQLLKKTGLLRGAGEDVSMHDSSSKPQHRTMRSRATAQSKAMEAVKNKAAAVASQKAAMQIKARSGTPPEPRGPIRSRIPKRTQNSDVSVVQTWKTVIQSRYNAQARYLNLDNLSTDPELLSSGIPFNKIRESKELQVIMKIASQLDPAPITISMAHNGLDGSHIFSSLHRYIPNVVNLSLTGNKVRSSKDMEIFAGPKWVLTKLRELILLDNPICEGALSHGKIEEYRNEITRKFPSLEILDNVPVPHIRLSIAPTTPRIPLVLEAAKAFPVPMGANAIPADIQAFAFNFLQRYLASFDTSRPSLHSVYTPVSTFSFSYDSTIPPQSRQRGVLYKMPNQRKLDWSAWHSAGSRNLMKTHGSLKDARDRLFTGADDIIVGLGLLPATKHIVAEGKKFVVDAMQMDLGAGPQLFITIHGEFVEAPGVIDGIRSFDRTLLLSPAPDGSYAKQNGWDAMIISDQLNVRSYSSHESWAVGPMSTQAQEIAAVIASGAVHSGHPTRVTGDTSHSIQSGPASNSGSNMSAQPPSTETMHPLLVDLGDSQRASMIQFQAITGLNFQYTMMALEANGWDFAQAKANYDELVNSNPVRDLLLPLN